MWPELEAALGARRTDEALRLARSLWGTHRAVELAELVDALAGFVESDPRTAPAEAPVDAVALGGWLTNESRRVLDIWEGSWWTREWREELTKLRASLGALIEVAPDPRLATLITSFILEPFVLAHAWNETISPFVGLLTALADGRVLPPLMEVATSPEVPERARLLLARGIAAIDESVSAFAPLDAEASAIVRAGLARYRAEPQRYIDMILDPTRARDDGTEQVCSDALSELGHPYGEAIALAYDAMADTISAAGRDRLKTLVACNEERWLGRDVYLSLEDRVYRGGLLEEATLRPGWRNSPANATVRRALDDMRVAWLRVLRSGADDWDGEQASMLRASRWLTKSLEWLDAPSFEFLCAACEDPYPNLIGLRLQRLRSTRHNPRWSGWAPALAEWTQRLPSLREVVFRTIPEDGLDGLVRPIVEEQLHRRVETLTLDARSWSWILTGERDPTRWFEMLDPHGVGRATLHTRAATLTVAWNGEGALDVTLCTSEGGDAFDLLRKLPARPIARIVLDDHPDKRARRIENMGRLKRILALLAPRALEMPVRWRNLLAALE